MSALEQPVLGESAPPARKAWPATAVGFTSTGALIKAFNAGDFFRLWRVIRIENRAVHREYLTFEQYDRIFDLLGDGQRRIFFLADTWAQKKVRLTRARAKEPTLSPWHFHLMEQRHFETIEQRAAEIEIANRKAIEDSVARSHRDKVTEYERDARARVEARENVARERGEPPKRRARVATSPAPAPDADPELDHSQTPF